MPHEMESFFRAHPHCKETWTQGTVLLDEKCLHFSDCRTVPPYPPYSSEGKMTD